MDQDSKIILITSDKKEKEIGKNASLRSGLLKGLMEDFPDNTSFSLNQVDEATLTKIIEYLLHYENSEPDKIDIPLKSSNFKECVSEWDYNFIGEDTDIIFNLLSASNYMDIKALYELCSAKLGSKIKGIPSEKVKKDFGIGALSEKEKEEILNYKNLLEQNIN